MVSAKNDEVKVSWYCGHYVGPATWRRGMSDWICEPDECGNEFETDEYKEDWDEKTCSVTCPNCGAELTQEYDEPILVQNRKDT